MAPSTSRINTTRQPRISA
jgi:pimeloyl-ACP methyl ester carboxylesterase